MINQDFFLALDDLEREKGIAKDEFIAALEEAMVVVYKKSADVVGDVKIKLNPEKKSINIYSVRNVVNEITDPERDITVEKAQEIKKNAKAGDTLTVDLFTEEDWVDVTGISKGKGFQGVVKRHGFGGVGGQTHGQHNRQRKPGSLGASSYPSRVFKGKRLPGQMGGEQVKVLNLRVLKVIPESNLILVKGSIPGAKGAYLTIEK